MTDFVRIIRIRNSNGEEKLLKIPAKLDLERPKRPRTVFTDEQLQKLEESFNESGYLCGISRAKLAEKLGLSDNQVKVWFQNRRTKQKKIDSSLIRTKSITINNCKPEIDGKTIQNCFLWMQTNMINQTK